MYMRQVYKVHLKQQTLKSDDYSAVQPARIFRGVDKDKNRKGELFGLENLLKFKNGSFMEAMWKAASIPPPSSDGMLTASTIGDVMNNVSADQIEHALGDDELPLNGDDVSGNVNDDDKIPDSDSDEEMKGFNHEDFLREDKGNAAILQGDEGFEEEMGIESQMVDMACNMSKTVGSCPDNVAVTNEPFGAATNGIGNGPANTVVKKETSSAVTSSIGYGSENAAIKEESSGAVTNGIGNNESLYDKANGDDDGSDENVHQHVSFSIEGSTEEALFASVEETLKPFRSKSAGRGDPAHPAKGSLFPKTTTAPLRANTSDIERVIAKSIANTNKQPGKPKEAQVSNKDIAGASGANNQKGATKGKLKKPGTLQGAKNNIPSFSSRQMLYIPSYLRDNGKKK